MKNLFDGLLLYEVTLLILGVVLFLILSIGLLYYILKKEQIAKLLAFFIIPIVMIGYPSINQISISNDKIELTKYQQQLIENPDDSVAMKKVETITEKLEERATSPKDLVQVSTSNLLLGNTEKAAKLASQALAKDTNNVAAQDLKILAAVQQNIQKAPETTLDTTKTRQVISDVKVTTDLSKLKPYLIRKSNQNLRVNPNAVKTERNK